MAEIYIGRQPIFDRNLDVFAYELLFRDGVRTESGVIDGDAATSTVILNAMVDIGLEKLVGKHQAFINLTRSFLVSRDLHMLSPGQCVLEVLEDVTVDAKLIDSIARFKKQGFKIALDDYVFDKQFEPLVDMMDFIKIDVMALEREQIATQLLHMNGYQGKLLAEKIETREEYHYFHGLGFHYFQGYFFEKPTIVKSHTIPPSKLTVLQLISKINNPNVELEELSQIISRDIALSTKVLKGLNAPINGLVTKVESIKHATTMLGLNMLKNWATLISLANLGTAPAELFRVLLVRAKLCELLANSAQASNAESYFMVGLLSGLDVIMNSKMEDALEQLPLREDIKEALLCYAGEFGAALSCVIAAEKGDMSNLHFMNMLPEQISGYYLEAIQWADVMMGDVVNGVGNRS